MPKQGERLPQSNSPEYFSKIGILLYYGTLFKGWASSLLVRFCLTHHCLCAVSKILMYRVK